MVISDGQVFDGAAITALRSSSGIFTASPTTQGVAVTPPHQLRLEAPVVELGKLFTAGSNGNSGQLSVFIGPVVCSNWSA